MWVGGQNVNLFEQNALMKKETSRQSLPRLMSDFIHNVCQMKSLRQKCLLNFIFSSS